MSDSNTPKDSNIEPQSSKDSPKSEFNKSKTLSLKLENLDLRKYIKKDDSTGNNTKKEELAIRIERIKKSRIERLKKLKYLKSKAKATKLAFSPKSTFKKLEEISPRKTPLSQATVPAESSIKKEASVKDKDTPESVIILVDEENSSPQEGSNRQRQESDDRALEPIIPVETTSEKFIQKEVNFEEHNQVVEEEDQNRQEDENNQAEFVVEVDVEPQGKDDQQADIADYLTPVEVQGRDLEELTSQEDTLPSQVVEQSREPFDQVAEEEQEIEIEVDDEPSPQKTYEFYEHIQIEPSSNRGNEDGFNFESTSAPKFSAREVELSNELPRTTQDYTPQIELEPEEIRQEVAPNSHDEFLRHHQEILKRALIGSAEEILNEELNQHLNQEDNTLESYRLPESYAMQEGGLLAEYTAETQVDRERVFDESHPHQHSHQDHLQHQNTQLHAPTSKHKIYQSMPINQEQISPESANLSQKRDLGPRTLPKEEDTDDHEEDFPTLNQNGQLPEPRVQIDLDSPFKRNPKGIGKEVKPVTKGKKRISHRHKPRPKLAGANKKSRVVSSERRRTFGSPLGLSKKLVSLKGNSEMPYLSDKRYLTKTPSQYNSKSNLHKNGKGLKKRSSHRLNQRYIGKKTFSGSNNNSSYLSNPGGLKQKKKNNMMLHGTRFSKQGKLSRPNSSKHKTPTKDPKKKAGNDKKRIKTAEAGNKNINAEFLDTLVNQPHVFSNLHIVNSNVYFPVIQSPQNTHQADQGLNNDGNEEIQQFENSGSKGQNQQQNKQLNHSFEQRDLSEVNPQHQQVGGEVWGGQEQGRRDRHQAAPTLAGQPRHQQYVQENDHSKLKRSGILGNAQLQQTAEFARPQMNKESKSKLIGRKKQGRTGRRNNNQNNMAQRRKMKSLDKNYLRGARSEQTSNYHKARYNAQKGANQTTQGYHRRQDGGADFGRVKAGRKSPGGQNGHEKESRLKRTNLVSSGFPEVLANWKVADGVEVGPGGFENAQEVDEIMSGLANDEEMILGRRTNKNAGGAAGRRRKGARNNRQNIKQHRSLEKFRNNAFAFPGGENNLRGGGRYNKESQSRLTHQLGAGNQRDDGDALDVKFEVSRVNEEQRKLMARSTKLGSGGAEGEMRAGQKDLEPNINSQERNTYGLRAGLTRMKASYFSSGGDSRVSTNLFLGELAGRHIARNKGLHAKHENFRLLTKGKTTSYYDQNITKKGNLRRRDKVEVRMYKKKRIQKNHPQKAEIKEQSDLVERFKNQESKVRNQKHNFQTSLRSNAANKKNNSNKQKGAPQQIPKTPTYPHQNYQGRNEEHQGLSHQNHRGPHMNHLHQAQPQPHQLNKRSNKTPKSFKSGNSRESMQVTPQTSPYSVAQPQTSTAVNQKERSISSMTYELDLSFFKSKKSDKKGSNNTNRLVSLASGAHGNPSKTVKGESSSNTSNMGNGGGHVESLTANRDERDVMNQSVASRGSRKLYKKGGKDSKISSVHSRAGENNKLNSSHLSKKRAGKKSGSNLSSKTAKKRKSVLKGILPKFEKIYYLDKLVDSLTQRDEKNPFYQHFLQAAQSIMYIKTTEKVPDVDLLTKKVYLPPLRDPNMKTLIFDLDETLIHCNDEASAPCHIRVPIRFSGTEVVDAGLTIRPFARNCLERLSKSYELVIFTASHSCYANIVLNLLDPDNKYITARLFREHCVKTSEGIFVKDLRVFANRKFKNLILVDNAFYSFGYQMYNGIPILPFYEDKRDRELLELADFLERIKGVGDVREAISYYFIPELYRKYSNRLEILRQMIIKERKKIV